MKITAKTKEEFEQIEQAFKKLPSEVQSLIESAEKTLGGIRYNFSQKFDSKVKLIVPEIKYSGYENDGITILSKDNSYFKYPYKAESFEIREARTSKS